MSATSSRFSHPSLPQLQPQGALVLRRGAVQIAGILERPRQLLDVAQRLRGIRSALRFMDAQGPLQIRLSLGMNPACAANPADFRQQVPGFHVPCPVAFLAHCDGLVESLQGVGKPAVPVLSRRQPLKPALHALRIFVLDRCSQPDRVAGDFFQSLDNLPPLQRFPPAHPADEDTAWNPTPGYRR